MDAAATSAATQTAGEDLRYIWEENELSEHAHAVLATLGYDKIRRVARFAETEARLRAALRAQLPLGETTSVAERILVADIFSCMSEVQRQVARSEELHAEARAHGHQEPPQLCEHKSTMPVALQVHGKMTTDTRREDSWEAQILKNFRTTSGISNHSGKRQKKTDVNSAATTSTTTTR